MTQIRLSEDIRPLSELRVNAVALVEHVRRTRRPLVLTQQGRGAAVLLDLAEYERLVERAALLDDLCAADEPPGREEAAEPAASPERVLTRLK